MTTPILRERYLADSISTASPGKLLVLLYDRLVKDLYQGEEAIRGASHELAAERLLHAQEIILELRTTLDLDGWSGAPGLANLYGFLLTELIGANIRRDADRVASCRSLVEPLRDAWREAAVIAANQAAPVAAG
jgi:flagellar protein FliS